MQYLNKQLRDKSGKADRYAGCASEKGKGVMVRENHQGLEGRHLSGGRRNDKSREEKSRASRKT